MDTQICNHLEAEPIVNPNYGRFREKTFWKDAIFFDISSDIVSDSSHILFLTYFWHIFWHIFLQLRPGAAHSARELPGWGPALPSPLQSSPGEVQPCPVRSRAPRLRSGIAQSALELPGWGPALPTAIWSSLLRSGIAHCILEVPLSIWRHLAKSTARRKEKRKKRKKKKEGHNT